MMLIAMLLQTLQPILPMASAQPPQNRDGTAPPSGDGVQTEEAPMPDQAPIRQAPAAPAPDRHDLKRETRRIERVGALYETLGRCAGSMTPSEVEDLLRSAQAQPAAGRYLLGEFDKGFHHPKDDAWCHGEVAEAVTRATQP